ncbi:MAG: hypothetical protein K0R18_403 [Bacillales bacterium]|jgi:hypothetical protein|nr:hypothetical protein [Bacillales bacterium]
MKMTYEQYVLLVTSLDSATQEELNFFMRVESIGDHVFYYMKEEGMTIEEAEIKAKEANEATDNEMELAITGVKEQISRFKECEEKGHNFEAEDVNGPSRGYMGVVCGRCGFGTGSGLY